MTREFTDPFAEHVQNNDGSPVGPQTGDEGPGESKSVPNQEKPTLPPDP